MKGSFVDFAPTVRNDADNNLLPTICAPHGGSVATTEVGDILQNSGVWYQYLFGYASGHGDARVHGSTEQDLVFIVHGHHNEEFCTPAIDERSEAVVGAHEVIGIAGCGSVTYLGRFLEVVHATRNDVGGNLDVENKVSFLKFYVPDGSAFHELFPNHGVAGGHGGRVHREPKILGRRVIRLVRKRGRGRLIPVIRVEASLRVIGMKRPVRLCLPIVVVVVIVGMVGGGRGRIIWKSKAR